MAGHLERIKSLDQIERDIASALETAALAVQELGKDKANNRQVESHTQAFLKTINNIETNLIKQIQYLSQVSTGHPHTGSSYGAQKDYQLSVKRLDHVTSRLDELEKLRMEQLSSGRQADLRRHFSSQGSFGQSIPSSQALQSLPGLPPQQH